MQASCAPGAVDKRKLLKLRGGYKAETLGDHSFVGRREVDFKPRLTRCVASLKAAAFPESTTSCYNDNVSGKKRKKVIR